MSDPLDLPAVLKTLKVAVKLAGPDPADRALAWLSAAAPHLVEDLGSNEGRILSPLLMDRYRACWQVPEGISLPWCSIVGFAAQAVGLGILPSSLDGAENPSAWKAHPLGKWLGATWQAEREAKARGIWSSEPSPGALGLMLRAGSGSDAGSSGVDASGKYSGHTDIMVNPTNVVGVWSVYGGNLSDSLKRTTRDLSAYRGFVSII